MFIEFLTRNNFSKEYLEFFSNRFTYSNLELEHNNPDVSTVSISSEMFRNQKAFANLLKENPDRISPYDLIETASILNDESIAKGFRKTEVVVSKAKYFEPRNKAEVQAAVYYAFNNYHNVWNELDPYEREARLHIELVRIQPFEDGNKRTARIVTCFNLMKQNKAPILLTETDTEEYFTYIDKYDVNGLTKLFRRKSQEEFNVMLDLYQKIYPDGLFSDEEPLVSGDDSDVQIYVMSKIKRLTKN